MIGASVEHGDCVDVLPILVSGCAALVYMDPPFFTQRTWRTTDGLGFDDRFASIDAYLLWLAERLDAVQRLLAPDGVLVLHLDHHAVNEARILLDTGAAHGLLGEPINVITWKRSAGRNSSSTRNWAHAHDTLVVYSRAADWPFHPPVDVEAAGDVWLDVTLASTSHERTGWPTQKPVELLERLILTFTDPGDLVIDPMCGSGTTLVAASTHGRNSFGCDVSADAVEIARRRLDDGLQLQLGVA